MNSAALGVVLSVLWPQPRLAEPAPVTRIRLPIQVVASAPLAAPAELLRRELAALFGTAAIKGKGGTTIRLALSPANLPRSEEYTVEPGKEGVLLRAHDRQGLFWAVHTLAALLSQARRVATGYEADVPRIRDWPDTHFRAFMIQGAWTHSAEELKRNLELLARMRIRLCALEFGPQVIMQFDPSIAEGGRFTKAQAREVVDYGRSLGVAPIAYLNLLGHLERAYKKAPYTLHGGIDIRSDEAYQRFVYPILEEMLKVYGPVQYFHCGMDEAWELFAWLSREGADVVGLLSRHIQRINDFLKVRGVKTVIWHDMLIAPSLSEQLKGPVGPANGGPPQNTAGALASIPRDVILNYWFYDPLPAYPALDYLRGQGFTVWASPWQTPFSLTRYAQARKIPVLGTLWDGPPGCFGSATYSPVTAYYAQAVWNAAAAPEKVHPEPELRQAAQRATSAALWRRRSLTFPGSQALLLLPGGPKKISWPQEGVEQHYGVPMSTAAPVRLQPLPRRAASLDPSSRPASIRLPDGSIATLDGVNTARGEDQLILYMAPRERTGTNIYGIELSVSPAGVVLAVGDYGSGDHAIPAGGFVLSAHAGPNSRHYHRLQALRPGAVIAVLNATGEWVGGSAPTQLHAELPDGRTIRIDAQDSPRETDCLVLFHPGYGQGSTGTNPYGVEVVVREGKVQKVHAYTGNAAIPADGYVLSAHAGTEGSKAEALRGLEEGDQVRLLIDRGGQRTELFGALAERRQRYALNNRSSALFLAMSAETAGGAGTPLGRWVVRYADGTSEYLPVRYGREVLAPSMDSLPQRTDDPVWLIEKSGIRCLVREWVNPRPQEPLKELVFEPAPALLELGATIVAATAAIAP